MDTDNGDSDDEDFGDPEKTNPGQWDKLAPIGRRRSRAREMLRMRGEGGGGHNIKHPVKNRPRKDKG